MKRTHLNPFVLLLCAMGVVAAQTPVINIDATSPQSRIQHGTVGANHLWMDAGDGTVDTSTLAFKPGYVEAMKQMSLGSIRWPCGTRANLFRWKRAIGPVGNRTPIPLGEDEKGFGSKICYFGPDECGKLAELTGMEIVVLVNCATADANEAADLVEYMNAPVGTNPRGGTAWAELRAANGHPEPYSVVRWEIGNEYYLAGQNYWMDPLWGNRTAYAEAYALGGSATWLTNGAVKEADFSPAAMLGDGTANQVRFARYAPVDPAKPVELRVGGVVWNRVEDLSTQGASSQVYTMDFPTGAIRFGDGYHGARPGNGAEIRLSYTCGRHDGFVDYRREMKAVDPSIKVYPCLDWQEFCTAMGTNQYDGFVKHMYPSYGQSLPMADSSAAWAHRVTSAHYWFYDKVLDDYELIAKNASSRARDMDVILTEFGLPELAISNLAPGETIQGNTMGDAVWYGLLNQACAVYGLPLAQKHMLISNDGASDEKKHFLFHSGGGFKLGAIGHVTAQVSRLKDKRLLGSWTANNPVVASHGTFGTKQALQVTAAQDDDGALWLLVLNLDRTNNLATIINPLGFVNGGSASVWSVAPQNDVANNWDSHLNDVSTTLQTLPIASDRFTHTFPRHSVSVLKIPKEELNGGWKPIREYAFTNATTASNIWYPADLQWWLAGKASAVSAAPLGDPNGFALRLVGEDPSHGRASLTLPASFTTGLLRLSADIWFANRRNVPLYVTIGDNARVPLAGVAFSDARDGLLYSIVPNGSWQNTLCPFYQDHWQKLDLILDLDARKYEVLINGYKIFVGGEGRDTVSGSFNPINKVTFETGAAIGDGATFYIDNVTVSRFMTNVAPVISQVNNRQVNAGQMVVVTNTAVDPDSPPQVLTWTLLDGPTNSVLSPETGVFSWRPTIAQAPSVVTVSLQVQDNGWPQLNASGAFQLSVISPAEPTFSTLEVSDNRLSMQITGDPGPDYLIYASANLRDWELLAMTNPMSLPFKFIVPTAPASQQFYKIELGP